MLTSDVSFFQGSVHTKETKERMKINKEWHLAHRMPKNPTLDQRITWHLSHAKNCVCRPLSGKILHEIKKRGLKV